MQGIRLQRAPNFLWIYAGTTGEGGQVKGVRVLLFKPFKVWSFDICIEGFSCTFSENFELYATSEKTTLEEEQSKGVRNLHLKSFLKGVGVVKSE